MRFFTSDLHFGHERINALAGRPYASVDEMNASIIDNFNAALSDNDILFVLGDVAMGVFADSLPLMGEIRGIKYLCPGNHDRVFSGNKQKYIDRFRPQYLKYFDAILPENFSLEIGGRICEISHFPYTGDSHDEDRYLLHRPVDKGLPLLHGHVHSEWKVNGRKFNVGVDVNDFFPVPEGTIKEWLNGL